MEPIPGGSEKKMDYGALNWRGDSFMATVLYGYGTVRTWGP